MADPIISIQGLGKSYVIAHQDAKGRGGTVHYTLREVLSDSARKFARRVKKAAAPPPVETHARREVFWALRDVSFDVERGAAVGIIGHNGAGKSTLLKLLSRITEPSAGRAILDGRVASLLEVGTGFHPDLTGRENIYLNGAIMGLTRAEVRKKFDDIVAFAGVAKFLDTPTKRYSSGMRVRLGFAVAAHLEPEILIVDEVLAVGDAEFQQKCIGKMQDVARGEGRTVLFVSHDMGSIRELCQRTIVLRGGTVVYDGDTEEGVNHYLGSITHQAKAREDFPEDHGKPIQLRSVAALDEQGQPCRSFAAGQDVTLEVTVQVHEPLQGVLCAMLLRRNGNPLLNSFDLDEDETYRLGSRLPGLYTYRLKLPTAQVKAGLFTVSLSFGRPGVDRIRRYDDVYSFNIEEMEESSRVGYATHRQGVLRVPVAWELRRTELREDARELEMSANPGSV